MKITISKTHSDSAVLINEERLVLESSTRYFAITTSYRQTDGCGITTMWLYSLEMYLLGLAARHLKEGIKQTLQL